MRRSAALILVFLGLMMPASVKGDMVSSDNNYRIYADVIDTGGNLSTGGVYSLEDSWGEAIASTTSGGVYEVRGGYQAMVSSTILMSFSSSALDLGNIYRANVNSVSTVVTVTTDDESGYALSIGEVSGSSLTAVADGTVSAGVEEYGFASSGDDNLLSGDNAVTAGTQLAASSTPVYNSQTTLTFKASVSQATTAGARSQTIILQAAANLTL